MTTYAILNIDESDMAIDPSFKQLARTNFVLVDSVQKGTGREALYQKVAGSDQYPMSVRVGHYPANGGGANISVKINTFVECTNGEVITYLPCSATLATSIPVAGGIADSADYKALVMNLFAWLFPRDTVSGEFLTTGLDQVKFGVVNQLNLFDETA